MSKDIFAYKLNHEPRNGLSGCKLKTPDIKSKQHKRKDFYIGSASLTLRQKLRQKNESLLLKEMLCKECFFFLRLVVTCAKISGDQ